MQHFVLFIKNKNIRKSIFASFLGSTQTWLIRISMTTVVTVVLFDSNLNAQWSHLSIFKMSKSTTNVDALPLWVKKIWYFLRSFVCLIKHCNFYSISSCLLQIQIVLKLCKMSFCRRMNSSIYNKNSNN